MMRLAITTGVSLLMVALGANGNPAPAEAVTGEPRLLQLPAESVSPGAAQAFSAAVLTVGGVTGATMLTISAARRSSALPGAIVTGIALVFAPSLGRWIAGDSSGAARLTLFRLLPGASAGVMGAAATATALSAPCLFCSISPAKYPIAGALGTVVLVHAIYDVATTRRDILLDRAVRTYTQTASEFRVELADEPTEVRRER